MINLFDSKSFSFQFACNLQTLVYCSQTKSLKNNFPMFPNDVQNNIELTLYTNVGVGSPNAIVWFGFLF
jgi:hypothetical protein